MAKETIVGGRSFVNQNSNAKLGAAPQFFQNHINLLSYTAVYDDGNCYMHSGIKGWESYILSAYDMDSGLLTCRLKSGIHLWKKIPDLQDILDNTFQHNLDVDSVIELVRRDEVNKCFHLYAFCSTHKQSSKAEFFYERHLNFLLEEVSRFDSERRARDEPRDFFRVDGYQAPENTTNEPKATEAENLELTNKEFTTLLLAASGCTSLEISKKLLRTEKSVERYLHDVRYKTGCKDKKDMSAYVRAKGWQDLIGFFF